MGKVALGTVSKVKPIGPKSAQAKADSTIRAINRLLPSCAGHTVCKLSSTREGCEEAYHVILTHPAIFIVPKGENRVPPKNVVALVAQREVGGALFTEHSKDEAEVHNRLFSFLDEGRLKELINEGMGDRVRILTISKVALDAIAKIGRV